MKFTGVLAAIGATCVFIGNADACRLGEDVWECVKPTALRFRAQYHPNPIVAGERFDLKAHYSTFEVEVASTRNCTQTGIEVEVAKNGSPFTGQPTVSSDYKQLCVDLPDGDPCPNTDFKTSFRLHADTDYRWRTRTKSAMRLIEIGSGKQVCKEVSKVFYSNWVDASPEGASFSTTAGWMQTSAAPPLVRLLCGKVLPGNPSDFFSESRTATCGENSVDLRFEFPVSASKSASRDGRLHVQLETDAITNCELIGMTARGDRDLYSGDLSGPNDSVEVSLGSVKTTPNTSQDVALPLAVVLPSGSTYEMVSYYDRSSWRQSLGVVATRVRCIAAKPFRLRVPAKNLYYKRFLYDDPHR